MGPCAIISFFLVTLAAGGIIDTPQDSSTRTLVDAIPTAFDGIVISPPTSIAFFSVSTVTISRPIMIVTTSPTSLPQVPIAPNRPTTSTEPEPEFEMNPVHNLSAWPMLVDIFIGFGILSTFYVIMVLLFYCSMPYPGPRLIPMHGKSDSDFEMVEF